MSVCDDLTRQLWLEARVSAKSMNIGASWFCSFDWFCKVFSSGQPISGDNMAMRHRTASLIAIEDRLNDVLDKFCLSDEELLNVEKLVESDIREQLSQQPMARDRMLPTYVVKLPDGTEVFGSKITLENSKKKFQKFSWKFRSIFS